MIALDDKLRGETLLFNGLMYIIMFVGWLVATLLSVAASYWNQSVSWYVLYVQIGTLAGATLCHFFVHVGYSYSAKRGDSVIRAYEKHRAQHIAAKIVVPFCNLVFFSLMNLLTLRSFEKINRFGDQGYSQIAIAAALGLLWVTFALAPGFAKNGWKFESVSK